MSSTGQRGTPVPPAEQGGTPAQSAPPAAPAAPSRWRSAAWYWPALGAALVMAVLGVWGLERDSSMGNDEVATRWAALLPLHQLAHLVKNLDAVHGLYYLLMHGWVAVGTSPAVLRIPSVLSMVVAAALVAILARQLTGSGWAALFAGLIMALTPTITYYAQTARSYALVYACVVGATLVLLRALRAEHSAGEGRLVVWPWLGYGALMLVAGYLNEMALLALIAHGVTVLLTRYGRRVFLHWAAPAVLAAVLVIPLAVVSAREDAAVAWIPRPGLGSAWTLFHDYFGASTGLAVLLFVCAVLALLPGRGQGPWPEDPAGTAAPWWRRGGVSVQSVAAPLLILPGLVLALESRVAHPLYVDRYVLYGEAGAALLAGAGAYRAGGWLAGRARQPGLAWVAGAVVCVLALVLQLGPQQRVRTPQSRLYDFGGPSRYLAGHAHQGDGVLFFSAFFRKARLGYPAEFSKVDDFAMAVSPRQAGNFRGTDKPFAQVRPLMLAQRRIWVVGRSPFAQLASPDIKDESRLLQSGFTLVAKQHFRHIWVTLWVRR
ncbi:MAG TPA: glycosyltransferase family 39 protein [Streptosporangiaceae bacterium]